MWLTWSPVIDFSLCTALSDSSKLVRLLLLLVSADSELTWRVLLADTTETRDKPRKTVLDKLSILDWSFFSDWWLCFVSENSWTDQHQTDYIRVGRLIWICWYSFTSNHFFGTPFIKYMLNVTSYNNYSHRDTFYIPMASRSSLSSISSIWLNTSGWVDWVDCVDWVDWVDVWL